MKIVRHAFLLCAACAWFGFSLPAHSTIITVEFSTGTYSPPNDDLYSEDGFGFSVPTGNHTDCGPTGAAAFGITPFLIYCWHNGGGNPGVDNNVTLDFGGAAFDLISLDIVSDIFGQNQVNPDPFTIDFASSAGTLTVDGNDLTTVNFNWTNIMSVSMSVNDAPTCAVNACRHNALIDNVVLNNVPTISSVPEPSTALLLGAGLLGVGCVRKRRKT